MRYDSYDDYHGAFSSHISNYGYDCRNKRSSYASRKLIEIDAE